MNAVDQSQYAQQQPARYPLERSKYWLAILFGLLGAVIYIGLGRFFAVDSGRQITDFDVFHLVGQFVNRGEAGKAYYFQVLGPAQAQLNGAPVFMPWTYPPPFNLVVGALSMLPLGWAYALFTLGTLSAYLLILRKIAGTGFALLFVVAFPTLAVTIACGQNGFLTGSLVGLASVMLMRGRAVAGVPLGLLIIKPHLGVPFGVMLLVKKRYRTVVVTALTALSLSALATVLLGLDIWPSFLEGVRQSKIFLSEGYYPQYRMVSIYATLRSLGAPMETAAIAQSAMSALVIWLTLRASLPGYTVRQAAGVAACGALLVSPYAYDYDLPIYIMGLALLLPDFVRHSTAIERFVLYSFTFVTGVFGLVQSRLNHAFDAYDPWTIAGFTLAICFLVVCRVVARGVREAQAKFSI